jgi:hypothetical protein
MKAVSIQGRPMTGNFIHSAQYFTFNTWIFPVRIKYTRRTSYKTPTATTGDQPRTWIDHPETTNNDVSPAAGVPGKPP